MSQARGIGDNGGPGADNWVAVDRDMRFHPVVGFLNKDGTLRKGVVVNEASAWFDLICEAHWRDREVNNKGLVTLVERGQLLGAGAWLAERWGWTRDKVRWFLKKLESEGMISVSSPKSRTEKNLSVNQIHTQSNAQRRAHYANVITICNYNVYQTLKELDAYLSTPSNTQSTPNQHPHLNNTERDIRARTRGQSDVAWPNGDFVHANGEAIYVSLLGKRLKFEYAAIDQWAALGMCKAETARQIVEAEARGWVSDQKWPDLPSRWLQSQISKWRVHKAVAEIRVENERKRGDRRPAGRGKSVQEMTAEEYQAYLDKGYS